jgi:2-polyprenyl-3-methyl-5-hydroxy-6-metoxy-1,4-benzoquinol methylase
MQLARIGTYRCFFEVLGPAAGRSLLDVGCGIGRFALAAHAFGWRVMGIDPSATALRVGAPHAPFPLRQETIADHLRANVAYDVVTAFEVVEHLDDPLPFVRDLRSALKPDGSLFVTVPNWDCPAVRSSTVPEHLPPWHVLFFGRRALAALLRAAGLRRVRMGWVFCAAPRRVDPLIRWWANRLLRPARVAPGLWACGVR